MTEPVSTDTAVVRRPRFIMIGATGYIGPKHRAAIKHVGGELVAIHNRGQNVGFMNQEWPRGKYYKDPWRFLRKLWRFEDEGQTADYLVVCTPNHLHDSMVVVGMKFGMDIIVEKPTCILPKTVDLLKRAEAREGHRVWTVLQTKYHPAIAAIQEQLRTGFHEVDLRWTTDRQDWYYWTWKNSIEESGGLIYNIGSHFLHLLGLLFGAHSDIIVRNRTERDVRGLLRFERAIVNFDLSIDPARPRERKMVIDGNVIDFTDGFDSLHNRVYEEILGGRGIGLDEVRPSIELAQKIQNAPVA